MGITVFLTCLFLRSLKMLSLFNFLDHVDSVLMSAAFQSFLPGDDLTVGVAVFDLIKNCVIVMVMGDQYEISRRKNFRRR